MSHQIEIEIVEKEAIEKLIQLIKGDVELPQDLIPHLLRDDLLNILIRARRNRSEFSLKLIKTLIKFKTEQYPHLLEDLSPASIKTVLENDMIRIVKTDESGPAVLVFRTVAWPPSTTPMATLIKAGFLYALYVTQNSIRYQRNGIIMVMDMAGFGFSHAKECSYSNVTMMANCIIFGSPFRINGAYLLNSPYVFEKVWQVVKFAIPEYYRGFITVTRSDYSKLHSVIPPKALPASLGGHLDEEDGWEQGLSKQIQEAGAPPVVQDLMNSIELVFKTNKK